MISLEQWLIFAPIALMYIASPGPAVFLAMTHGAYHGPRKTISTILGNVTGLAIISTVSALGLGAIIISSAILFNILKACGAIYLIYIGLKFLVKARTASPETFTPAAPKAQSLYFQGLFMSLSNPKPIVFFTALFPQFLIIGQPMFPQFLLLTLTFMSISFISLSAYAVLASPVKQWLKNPSKGKLFNYLTGTMFIGMGVLLAYTDIQNAKK